MPAHLGHRGPEVRRQPATYISNLRSALGLRSRNGYVVSTVYNYGYRLERVA